MNSELPAELLYVQDLITRLPHERARILQHEVRGREREDLQCRAIRQLMNAQAWTSFRSVLIFSLTVFLLLAALGQLVGLAKWVQSVQQYSVDIPSPIGKGILLSASEFIPKSSLVDLAARLPEYGVLEAAVISVIILIFLVAWRAYTGYFLFRQARALRRVSRELGQELKILRTWEKELPVDEAPKKT